jgi:hypothetical protein
MCARTPDETGIESLTVSRELDGLLVLLSWETESQVSSFLQMSEKVFHSLPEQAITVPFEANSFGVIAPKILLRIFQDFSKDSWNPHVAI